MSSTDITPATESSPAKRGPGRPSPYDPVAHPRLASSLSRLGATMPEVAEALGVAVSTVYLWRSTHPEFSEALQIAKDVADNRVERSLYEKAHGYAYSRVLRDSRTGLPLTHPDTGEVLTETVHVPPDTTAMIFWLKNRRPEDWRDKREVHHEHREVSDLRDEDLMKIIEGELVDDAETAD